MNTPTDKLFITKDSGQREEFETGARRDIDNDKPNYETIPIKFLKEIALKLQNYPDARLDLVPTIPLLRLAGLFGRGAKKYGENNYEKGIPFLRMFGSLLRHTYQYMEGDKSEDHLSAIAWGAFALMFYEEQIDNGVLPKELNNVKNSI